MNKLKIILLSLLFILPSVSFGATTYRYNTCTDWAFLEWTCENGTFISSFTPQNIGWVQAYTNTENTPFLSEGVWYISVSYAGNGTIRFIDNGSELPYLDFSNSLTDSTFISNGSSLLELYSIDFIGTISNLCITDTIGGCAVTPPAQAGGLFPFKKENGEHSNSATDLVASVGIVSTDTFGGVLPYMLLVMGVGVAFYIVESLKKTVVPKDTKKVYDIIPKTEGGVVHTTFQERKKDL